jgi:hypothetical protein
MLRFMVLIVGACAWLISACSPTYNWREVRMSGAEVTVLLPCKPDHGSKKMNLAAQEIEIQMAGCEADGALFAIAHGKLGNADKLAEVQSQWQSAMLGNMQAQSPKLSWYLVKGTSGQQKTIRLVAQGKRQDGSAVVAHALWFAREAHLYHAVVYTDKPSAEAVETFFSGIELQ